MSELNVMVKIRDMILTGVLVPGQRVVEAAMAKSLNVSRTPVRHALPALAKEGLLEPRGRRGFAVKAFSAADSIAALDLRGVLEGVAAKTIATRGITKKLLDGLKQCLSDGDELFAKRHLTDEDEQKYADLNGRFHSLIVVGSNVPMLIDFVAKVNLVPFVEPAALAFDKVGLTRAFEVLSYAHNQHHAIVNAIVERDATRAEFHLREHTHTQRLAMWSEPGWEPKSWPGNV